MCVWAYLVVVERRASAARWPRPAAVCWCLLRRWRRVHSPSPRSRRCWTAWASWRPSAAAAGGVGRPQRPLQPPIGSWSRANGSGWCTRAGSASASWLMGLGRGQARGSAACRRGPSPQVGVACARRRGLAQSGHECGLVNDSLAGLWPPPPPPLPKTDSQARSSFEMPGRPPRKRLRIHLINWLMNGILSPPCTHSIRPQTQTPNHVRIITYKKNNNNNNNKYIFHKEYHKRFQFYQRHFYLHKILIVTMIIKIYVNNRTFLNKGRKKSKFLHLYYIFIVI